MNDSQAESSSDGGIHTRPLFRQDLKAKRCTLSRICHHGTLVEDLEQNESTSERNKDDGVIPPFIISWIPWTELQFGQQTAEVETYLWVSEVDLHNKSHSNTCGKGEAGCDDDCQPISLAGAALCEGVFSRLMQRSQVVAGQVRSWGWETLKARWLQKQIWV